jgi:hypothetical protein
MNKNLNLSGRLGTDRFLNEIKNKKTMKTTIVPGVGFGTLKFGMSEEEVIKKIGKPDEIEVQEMDDEESINIYYYDDLGVSMSFDSMEDFRLVEFAFDDSRYTMEKDFFPGMSKDLFLENADKLGDYDMEDVSGEDTDVAELYVFEDKNINVWVKDGVVDTIQIGPFWSDDENVAWPQ